MLLLLAVGGHAQAAPTQITIAWTNPAGITGAVIFRGTCAGTVTGTAQPDGAIVGQCSPIVPQSAMVSYDTMITPTSNKCTPTAPQNACYWDNAIAPCISTGCVYDVEVVNANGTSVPSGTIAVSWNAPPVVTPPTPPPPATNLTIIAHAKTSSGSKETLTASWKDAPGVPTACILWGSGKVVKTCAPSPTAAGSYSFTWTGNAIIAASLDVCDDVVGCLGPMNF